MKKIMVIAGGTWQVPLIKKIKNMNYEVVNSNLYEDSIGFDYADEACVADVKNQEQNLEFAYKYNVDAVLTDQTDIAVPTVAYVAEKIGCKSIGIETARLFTNKYKMREYCSLNNFNGIEYRLCERVEEAIEFYENLNKRVIIKPLDAQSSRGVHLIQSSDELLAHFDETRDFSSDGKYVIVERYIEGTEFTIDGIVINGKHYTTAISEKAHYDYNPNIAKTLLFTHENEKYDYVQLRQQHDKLIDSTNLPFGLTHAEYKFENGQYYLIEMAARGGGTKLASDIAPYVSGIDTYKILIESSLGNCSNYNIDYTTMQHYKDRCAILEFLDIKADGKRVIDIKGIPEIREIAEVVELQLEFKVGDIIEPAEDDRSRIGFFIICAENRKRLDEVRTIVKERLKIELEE